MNKAVFITGTDTDIGKTFVSCLLLKAFNALGLETCAMKPIASGAEKDRDSQLKNQDALLLQASSSIQIPYHVINPFLFKKPIAPHIAAGKINRSLSMKDVSKTITSFLQKNPADIALIEGVGGWAVPLNNDHLYSDCISALRLPVILVIGLKLGCLNHALLTYQSMLYQKVPLLGWVANCLDPEMLVLQENIQTLRRWIDVPCLGVIPYNAHSIDLSDAQKIYHRLLYDSGITR